MNMTTKLPTIDLEDRTYVMLPEEEYEDLLARAMGVELPAYPPPDSKGRVPAVGYGRASVARELILRRAAANWTQEQLARKAGVRAETISRIESGKHRPQAGTVERLDRALARAGV